jgi:asparagine synthase (glutamine-hydrolysing)
MHRLGCDDATAPSQSRLTVCRAPGGFAVVGNTGFSWGRKVASAPARPPDGAYLSWTWDGSTLELESHPDGFVPVYYWLHREGISVSTSILALLEQGAPPDLDHQALSVFMRLGFYLGEDTPFKAIRALPASGRLRWSHRELSFPGSPPSPPRTTTIGRPDALAEYARLFRQAVARRAPRGPFAVPLSGGRDSRHIVLELLSQGHRPDFCVTASNLPPRNAEDVRVATRLARTLDLRHIVAEQSRWRLNAELSKNEQTSFCADEHTWAMPIADVLAAKVGEAYDGIGGDVLSAGLFLDESTLRVYQEGRYQDVARTLLNNWSIPESTLRSIVGPALRRQLSRESAEERVIAELGKFGGWHNPLTAFYFFNRTRREISLYAVSMLMDRVNVLCPYLDRDVVDFLTSLPAELFLDHTFHTDTIAAHYPRYEHIDYAEPGTSSSPHRNYWRRFSLELLWYFIRERDSAMVDIGWLVPRLIANTVLGWQFTGPLPALYLAQLGRVCDRHAGSRARGVCRGWVQNDRD